MSFEKLNLIEPILRALREEGYEKPTPIQQQAIPIILRKRDLLGCAQTGTGKTAAFAIPILQLLKGQPQVKGQKPIRALILTPTRELAIQIDESFGSYGRYVGLSHAVIFGGVGDRPQIDALRKGIDILVATPGRLLDLMGQGYVALKNLDFFVLDEADRMLDMGFIHDVKKVIATLPEKRQSLFFSATMPPAIVSLSKTILTDPVKVEVTPVSSTADTIQQSVYFVDQDRKRELLVHVLQDKTISSALVFTRTKYGADKVARMLKREGIRSEAIHGDKSQTARQNALSGFKAGKIRVLVATDIAARGIDVDDLSHVINYEIPNVPETYVHRIGRTGRAGASGKALSFCNNDERAYLRDIHKLISKTIPVVEDHPFLPGDPVADIAGTVVPVSEKALDKKPSRNARTKRTSANTENLQAEIKTGKPVSDSKPQPKAEVGNSQPAIKTQKPAPSGNRSQKPNVVLRKDQPRDKQTDPALADVSPKQPVAKTGKPAFEPVTPDESKSENKRRRPKRKPRNTMQVPGEPINKTDALPKQPKEGNHPVRQSDKAPEKLAVKKAGAPEKQRTTEKSRERQPDRQSLSQRDPKQSEPVSRPNHARPRVPEKQAVEPVMLREKLVARKTSEETPRKDGNFWQKLKQKLSGGKN